MAQNPVNLVVNGDLADLGDVAGPQLAGILMPRADLGAAKIGITGQFLEQAGTYHERYTNVLYFRRLIEQATRGRLAAEPLLILDIGSGSGNSVLPCLELFQRANIVATDLSENLLAILRDHVAADMAARARLTLVCIDATQADLIEGSVDLVIGAAILHHLIDPFACVRQACRALKPGGIAVFFEPFENGNAILRLAYEQILKREGTEPFPPEQRLAPEVCNCLRMLIDDLRIRAGTDKSAPIFQRIDDKWLFTRSYFEMLAAELDVSVVIEPLNQSDTPFYLQTQTYLRLALGLSPDDAIQALPIWAWNVLRAIDATFSPELKRDLPIEARVVFTRRASSAALQRAEGDWTYHRYRSSLLVQSIRMILGSRFAKKAFWTWPAIVALLLSNSPIWVQTP
jgi:ubiquinone/menaquinone biosynthesis C-methylase UbiE